MWLGGDIVQDMISKIVKMDAQARKITEEVQSNIEKSDEEVVAYRKKIQVEYLDRARKRIQKNRVNEQEISDKMLNETREKNERLLAKMEDQCKLNFDIWVNKIVERAVGE